MAELKTAEKKPPSDKVATGKPLDEFEKLRRAQETKNEILITTLRGALFLGGFLGYLLSRFISWAPKPPHLVGIAVGLALIPNYILLFYLRSHPPYRPIRKYILNAVETIYHSLMVLLSTGYLPLPALYFMPIAIYATMIAMSGMRYSTRAVICAGAMGLLCHSILLLALPPSADIPRGEQIRMTAGFVSALYLISTTAAVAFSVSSLISIHRRAMEKERLARFLAPELVELIAQNPELLQRRTERRIATVLFTDIRGFTTVSANREPEQVVELLNQFLEEMTASIMTHRGMLDKYIGDSVMGVFGVPISAEDDAIRAMRAALDMQHRLIGLNEHLVQTGSSPLSIGIGLHTGELVVGTIGSMQRLEYTVIGDTVNVASRLEGLTRHYPVEILLSDATREALGDTFPLREVATVQVKGREAPVTLWSPE